MTDDWLLPLVATIFAANVLTAWFLWGMSRAFRITDDRQLDRYTFFALIVPLAIAMAGFFLMTPADSVRTPTDELTMQQVPAEDASAPD